MIKITNLVKSFGVVDVLKHLNLDIEDQGIIAILGPNGSGKTTLIKCILGMIIPQKGEILIDNRSILGEWAYRDEISYMPQIAFFPQNLSVQELIDMINNVRGNKGNEGELISTFKLEPFLDKKLRNLSGGTKQKVNIVLTFMFDSPIIILDEPTTGLDPVALVYLKELIFKERANGKLILFTTHIMNLVEEVAEKVFFILDGDIYFNGTVEEIKEQTNQNSLEKAIAEILIENYA